MGMIRYDYLVKSKKVTGNRIQPKNDLNASKMNLLQLEEDLIFMIFSFLTLSELCAMVRVSRYSSALTRLYFLLTFSQLDFNLILKDKAKHFQLDNINVLFEHFGDLISTLLISTQDFDNDTENAIYQLITDNCKESLNDLILEHVSHKPNVNEQLHALTLQLCKVNFSLEFMEGMCYELTIQPNFFVMLPQKGCSCPHSTISS